MKRIILSFALSIFPLITSADDIMEGIGLDFIAPTVGNKDNISLGDRPLGLIVNDAATNDFWGINADGNWIKGSSFDRLVQLDCKVLLLGCSMQAVSFVHLLKEEFKVPYRYWKSFTAPYSDGGECMDRTYDMYVRDLQMDPRLDLSKPEHWLQRQGKIHSSPLGMGSVKSFSVKDFMDVCRVEMRSNPSVLLKE